MHALASSTHQCQRLVPLRFGPCAQGEQGLAPWTSVVCCNKNILAFQAECVCVCGDYLPLGTVDSPDSIVAETSFPE
eukprot:109005-Amphidinium_carterae.2